jgi:iron complex outermembrane recepter protein
VGKIPGRIHCSSTAFLLAAAFWCCAVRAQILVHFDLPAQSLARSIKAIGTATNTDVGFSASQVAGLMAPSLRADLTVDGALMRVLAGTGLRPQHLDDHTIVIAVTDSSMSDSAELKVSPASVALVGPPGDSAYAMNVVNSTSSGHGDASVPGNAANSESKDSGSPTDQLQEVTVTGSHIRGVTPSSPVIQIGRDEIDRSGYVTVADIVRTLPQNFAGGSSPQTTTGAAPGASNNGSFGGGSAPNLRGLGASSTLTLIDGHRLAQDTDTGAVDITAVPLDAIERIAVITDGASAAYGSDAVAGVVNIISKAPYDGAKATISSGYATDGGALDKRASLLVGKTWDGGGALVTYEHEAQDSVFASQRNFTSTVYAPYTLLPSTNRNSYFLSGRQNLLSGLTASFEGFYTSRGAKFFSTEAPDVTFDVPSAVQSYGGTGELRALLPLDWVASLDGTFGNQRTDSPAYMLNASGPGSSFYYAEDITGSMRTVEMSADGPLFRAPGGTARLAIGGGHRREGFGDVVVFPGASNLPIGSGSRSVNYGFGELAVPVIAPRGDGHAGSLDLNVSGRLEHYSDFGQTAVPKLGLRYYLTQTLMFRGDWGRSFHAPTLYQVYAPPAIALETEPDPSSSNGVSPTLVRSGGNPGLRPERATTWTLGVDYKPAWLQQSQLVATYFNIAYRDRISQLANGPAALIDPIYAPFVTRSPSSALQQALISQSGGVLNNYTGAPYDPSSVAAVIDFRNVNISRQNIAGLDLLFEKKSRLSAFDVDEFFNGTYMQLRNQITNSAPDQELAGTVFNPPRLRVRGGATVVRGGWSGTGTINYSGRESNNLATGSRDVASWTTIDAQLAYVVPPGGLISGFRASLSAINLLDRSPPYLQYNSFRTGFNYDVANATPLGRFITLQLQKNW